MKEHIASISTFLGAVASIIAIVIFFSGHSDISKINENIGKETIQGEWNEADANKIVIESMKDFYKDNANLKHSVSRVSYIPYSSGEESYIVVAYTQKMERGEAYSCHACSVNMSIFEFSKNNKHWVLNNKDINVSEVGSWGEMPDVKAMEIGSNRFGIAIYQGYTGQGNTVMTTTIYSKLGANFKDIFSIKISESNTEPRWCTNWDSVIKFDKKGSSFYDFTILKEGIVEDELGNCNEVEEKTIYKFDGQEYSLSDLYQ